MPNVSLPTANLIYVVSSWILIVGAVAALIGTLGNIWSGGIRERYADERIATNEAETASAVAEAARANQATEEAKLEQERIRAQLAWRTLSQETATSLIESFSNVQWRAIVAYVDSDPESQFYAMQLVRVFQQSGWDIQIESRQYTTDVLFGIFVPGPDADATSFVRQTLQQAGIEFRTDDVPRPTMTARRATQGMAAEDRPLVTIMIGSKPPAI